MKTNNDEGTYTDVGIYVKCLLVLSNLNHNQNVSAYLNKYPKYEIVGKFVRFVMLCYVMPLFHSDLSKRF
jgi:uncharacterized protein YebE (UPF0316 family)